MWHKCLAYLDDMSLERTMPLSVILLLGFAKVWKVLENRICLEKFLETGQMFWKVLWLFVIYTHCKNWSALKKISKQRCGYLDEKSIWWHLSLSGDSSCFGLMLKYNGFSFSLKQRETNNTLLYVADKIIRVILFWRFLSDCPKFVTLLFLSN